MLTASGCTNVLFNPSPGLPLKVNSPPVEHLDVRFVAADGIELHGWFLPAEEARGTVVFADGAENVRHHVDNVSWLADRGYNVFLFNYRGYGDSAGEPSLPGLHRDMRAALHAADAADGLGRDRLVVFGQSLGGAVATVTLAQLHWADEIGALVVDSAPSGYRRIVREKLDGFWLSWPVQVPLSWLITDGFSPHEAAPDLPAIPKLWIANRGDTTVPPHHVEQLRDRAPEPNALWYIEPRVHMATFDVPQAREAFLAWLDRALATGSAHPAPSVTTRD